MFASGAVRTDHAIHKSLADYAASRGDAAWKRDGLLTLCDYHAQTQRAYTKLMIDINLLIARVMEHDHYLRLERTNAIKRGLAPRNEVDDRSPHPLMIAPL